MGEKGKNEERVKRNRHSQRAETVKVLGASQFEMRHASVATTKVDYRLFSRQTF